MSLLSSMYAPGSDRGRPGAPREDLRARLGAWKVYRRTLGELSALTDRELNDLGLRRAELSEVAREAAYGG